MNPAACALAALLPVMLGPLPPAPETLTAKLCGGGTISIPLPARGGHDPAPCHPKGCHAGGERKRFDRKQ